MTQKLAEEYLNSQLARLRQFGELPAISPIDFQAALSLYVSIVNLNAGGQVDTHTLETADSMLVEIIRIRQGSRRSSNDKGEESQLTKVEGQAPRNGLSTNGGSNGSGGVQLPICTIPGEPLSVTIIRERR